MGETMQPVECGACGWTGRRMTGNVVICPKCKGIAGFRIVRSTSKEEGNG